MMEGRLKAIFNAVLNLDGVAIYDLYWRFWLNDGELHDIIRESLVRDTLSDRSDEQRQFVEDLRSLAKNVFAVPDAPRDMVDFIQDGSTVGIPEDERASTGFSITRTYAEGVITSEAAKYEIFGDEGSLSGCVDETWSGEYATATDAVVDEYNFMVHYPDILDKAYKLSDKGMRGWLKAKMFDDQMDIAIADSSDYETSTFRMKERDIVELMRYCSEALVAIRKIKSKE